MSDFTKAGTNASRNPGDANRALIGNHHQAALAMTFAGCIPQRGYRSKWRTGASLTPLILGIALWLASGVTAADLSERLRQFFRGPAAPLEPRLDTNGPYLLAVTQSAHQVYRQALSEARALHPGAAELVFDPGNLAAVRAALRKNPPRYVLILILPNELDVNFAWRWLQTSTEVDADPLVDVRTGFITGATPAAAYAFLHRIRLAIENRTPLFGRLIDDLGPNSTVNPAAFNQFEGNFMVPALKVVSI